MAPGSYSPPSRSPDILRDPSFSSYREQLVEYLFVSSLLQDGWMRRGQVIDLLRSDVDGAGYDLVAECQGIARHIQMKSSVAGGRAQTQKVHTALSKQPSGCVVWVVLEPSSGSTLGFSYLVLGGGPGEPLPGLDAHRVARHTKANAEGVKAHRPAIRVVPKSKFTPLHDMAALSDWLFGIRT